MAKRKSGFTRQQEKRVAEIQAEGRVVPVGLFGGALPPEQVAEKMAHLRSGAAGAHADSKVTRGRAAGRTNRVGSRSTARKAAIKDTL